MRPVSTIKCNKKPFNKNTILLCLARPGKVATSPAGWSARAFRFFLLMKKRRVACGPIVSDTPARNISCPRTPFFSGAQKAPRLSKAGTGCVELSPGSLETEQAALAETQWRDGTAHTAVELLSLSTIDIRLRRLQRVCRQRAGALHARWTGAAHIAQGYQPPVKKE